MSSRSRSHGWSIRRAGKVWIAVMTVLVLSGVWLLMASADVARDRRAAEDDRTAALVVATALRDDSNNLTRFAQLYVVRGEPRFRRYFERILAIRGGSAVRPPDYDGTYWDRVLAGGESSTGKGTPQALDAQLDDLAVPERLVTRLRDGADLSNQLALLETSTMDVAAPRIAAGVDPSYAAAVSPLVDRLTNDYYFSVKGQIMANVAEFAKGVDRATAGRLDQLADRTSRNLRIGAVILAAEALWAAAIVFGSRSMLFGPLRELERTAHAVGRGRLGEQAEVTGAAELREVIGAFNVMSVAVSREARTADGTLSQATT